jgi:hypothetical protein
MFAAIRALSGQCSMALCLALALTSAATPAEPKSAREFSADIASRDAAGTAIGTGARLYAANGKVRIETPEVPTGFFLIDSQAGNALFVRPAQRIYMDSKQSTPLTQIFVPVDPNDPCPQWRAAAIQAGVPGADGAWRCKRIDTAIVGGRGTIEYRVVSPQQQSSRRWIAPDLGFPVKLGAADGTTVLLENIRTEAQPVSLFAVPQGFRKLDPQALIDRIKHSDVWVEPSK